jgi:hypothetical protein
VREGPHRPGPEPGWEESWYFDFTAPDGSLAGFVRLSVRPRQRVSWYWAYLVGRRRPLVVVRHHDVAPPRGGFEVRAEGLWGVMHCEAPDEHWSVGLEAFAVTFDDPLEACRSQRGDILPFGLDLEWEALGPVHERPPEGDSAGYEQAGGVHGEILLGEEAIDFEGSGHRVHCWGPVDWEAAAWCWSAGRLDDGTSFHGAAAGGPEVARGHGGLDAPGSGGSWCSEPFAVEGRPRPTGVPEEVEMRIGSTQITGTPLHHAPIPLDTGAGGGRLDRAHCRFESAAGSGYGWTEWKSGARSETAPG